MHNIQLDTCHYSLQQASIISIHVSLYKFTSVYVRLLACMWLASKHLYNIIHLACYTQLRLSWLCSSIVYITYIILLVAYFTHCVVQRFCSCSFDTGVTEGCGMTICRDTAWLDRLHLCIGFHYMIVHRHPSTGGTHQLHQDHREKEQPGCACRSK